MEERHTAINAAEMDGLMPWKLNMMLNLMATTEKFCAVTLKRQSWMIMFMVYCEGIVIAFCLIYILDCTLTFFSLLWNWAYK